MAEPKGPVTERLDVSRGVRYEKNSSSPAAQLVDLPHAALPEVHIAHSEGFIDQQNVRIDVNGNREGKPDGHAARIRLNRLVDEFADFGKVNDRLILRVHLGLRKSQDRAVQLD